MFVNELRKVFDHPVQGREASIQQGSHSVAEYYEFRTLAGEAGWDHFRQFLLLVYQRS